MRSDVYKIERMPGDGNCLFHSLSYPGGNHRLVRVCIVRHIEKHWDEFQHFVPKEERVDYLRRMVVPGTWGDELVLRAFSDLAKRRVKVYDSSSRRLLSSYGDEHADTTSVLFSGCHYDRLVLKKE